MNKRTLMLVRILTLTIFLVASCRATGREQVNSIPVRSLEGTVWTLESIIDNGSTRPLMDGTQISLRFEGGNVQGSAGCNGYGGAYDIQGERLRISPLDITEQRCVEPSGIMEQETNYIELLTAVETFEWNTNKLNLEMVDGKGLRFISAQSSPATPSSRRFDPQELEAFINGVIVAQLEAYHIPGAVVSVVKDGEIVLAKGYGYADIENPTPVVVNQTLFLSGSISKLFTWTALMQLVEEGKVHLNEDINTYLSDFKIPETYPQSITLMHLLTHTAGFESRNEGLFVRKAEEIIPLNEYLLKYQPARIYPPGQVTAYSNYGAALAGYIVEQVSSVPYEEYVQEHIFRPLEMTHSSFRRPLESELAGDLAVGYSFEDGAYQPQEEWVQPAPAGGLTATATDMARFMIAHLQPGSVGDASILRVATAQEMHKRQFANDPRANGWTYGFMEAEINRERIVWHGGATNFFHSALVLLPERDLGIFISFNSTGGSVARQAFIKAFLDHYYPVSRQALPIPPADFNQRIEQYCGTYLETRHNQTGVEKLLSLQAEVTVEAMGTTLKTVGIGFGWPERETARWVEVEPYVLQKIEGEGMLIFQTDGQGSITDLIDRNDPQVVYQKLARYETASFQLAVLLICILMFLSTALLWPMRLLLSRFRDHGHRTNASHLRLYTPLAWSFSVLSVFFIVAFFGMMTDPEIVFRVPPTLERLLLLPWILVIMVIGLIVLTAMAWVRRYWGVRGRVYFTALTLAAIIFLWWMNHWNLLFNVLLPR